MSGVSLGESHGRPITGSTLRRCNDRAGADHVVLIDVDSDTFSNVIFIDVPESTPKKFRRKTSAKKDKRRSPLRNIIFIDDDESSENEYPEFGVENDRHFFRDPSPSMRACSTSKSAKEPLNEIGDDCQLVRENIPPVKLSKCKRTYSGKAPVRNRYGLTSDSESGSSEDDEFMEDYSGQLREQWQKASLKRKKYSSGQSGVRDINSASGVRIQPDPGESEEHTSCSDYSNSSTDKEDLSPNSTRESRRTSGRLMSMTKEIHERRTLKRVIPVYPLNIGRILLKRSTRSKAMKGVFQLQDLVWKNLFHVVTGTSLVDNIG